jgi:N utilization substance protein A
MAKNEFIVAITQLAAEKNLPKQVVFDAVETALASAYKKDALATKNVVVKIDTEVGTTRIFTRKTVAEEVLDPEIEISPEDARKIRPGIQIGEHIDDEVAAQYAGRVAAQTAKQVVLQRLREAEREVVFEEYSGREGDIVSGEMVRMEGRNVIIDLGKAEALLPPPEQVRNEHYRSGQRMKFYVLEVYKAAKGPQVVVSRTHKNLIRRLFELEVPEIFKGIVEIKAIAREGGNRSKVAVWSTQEGVDPVGACVGLRGIRIQNIVNELNGERIDVVLWDPEASRFVAHALSPAQVVNVEIDPDTNTAEVVVPDRQLSLAIGKEGQNARLAAKLSGWRIDIKSQSVYDEVMASRPPEEREKKKAVTVAAQEDVQTAVAPAASAIEEAEAVAAAESIAAPLAVQPAPATPAGPTIRFAEEILTGDRGVGAAPVKAKKGGGRREREGEAEREAARAKKTRRSSKRVDLDEELDDDGSDDSGGSGDGADE